MSDAASTSRKRGRPSVGSVNVGVRFPPPDLAALDRWIARHPEPKPTRPEAVRRIVADYLTEGGHMRSRRDLRPSKKAEV
jgi:hypothetical protein